MEPIPLFSHIYWSILTLFGAHFFFQPALAFVNILDFSVIFAIFGLLGGLNARLVGKLQPILVRLLFASVGCFLQFSAQFRHLESFAIRFTGFTYFGKAKVFVILDYKRRFALFKKESVREENLTPFYHLFFRVVLRIWNQRFDKVLELHFLTFEKFAFLDFFEFKSLLHFDLGWTHWTSLWFSNSFCVIIFLPIGHIFVQMSPIETASEERSCFDIVTPLFFVLLVFFRIFIWLSFSLLCLPSLICSLHLFKCSLSLIYSTLVKHLIHRSVICSALRLISLSHVNWNSNIARL